MCQQSQRKLSGAPAQIWAKQLTTTMLVSALLAVTTLANGQTINANGTSTTLTAADNNATYATASGYTWSATNGGVIDSTAASNVTVNNTDASGTAINVNGAGSQVKLGPNAKIESDYVAIWALGGTVTGKDVHIDAQKVVSSVGHGAIQVEANSRVDIGDSAVPSTVVSRNMSAAWAGYPWAGNYNSSAQAYLGIKNATLESRYVNGHAIIVTMDSTGEFEDVTLKQTGNGSLTNNGGSALFSQYGSTITAKNVTAQVTGAYMYGLNANQAGKIVLRGDSTVEMTNTGGLLGYGIRANQNAGYVGANDKTTKVESDASSSLKIDTVAPMGYGVMLIGAASTQPSVVVDLKGRLEVLTTGSSAHGVYASDTYTDFTASKLKSIEARGASANAVNVTRGTANITGTGIAGEGTIKSAGIALLSTNTSAGATSTSLTGTNLDVTSTSAAAASAQYGGKVELNNTKLTGATHGVVMKGNANQPNASFSLDGGSIVAKGGDTIRADAGVAGSVFTVDIKGGATVDATTTGASGNVLNLTSPGAVNLGVTTGNLKGMIQQGSGDVNVNLANPNSVWVVTGNSVINNLVNNGVIRTQPAADPTNPSHFHTLIVEGERSGNGVFCIDVVLGDDTSLHDSVIELGGSSEKVTGTVLLDVRNPGGAGADTVNGIKVAEIVDHPTNADVVFALQHPVVTTTHEYYLEKKLNDSPGFNAWYLKSKLKASSNGVPIPATGPLALLLLGGLILGIVRKQQRI